MYTPITINKNLGRKDWKLKVCTTHSILIIVLVLWLLNRLSNKYTFLNHFLKIKLWMKDKVEHSDKRIGQWKKKSPYNLFNLRSLLFVFTFIKSYKRLYQRPIIFWKEQFFFIDFWKLISSIETVKYPLD